MIGNVNDPTTATTITLLDGSAHTPDVGSIRLVSVASINGLAWTEEGSAIVAPLHAVLTLS
ncbi:MAG: hypothetical protein OJJ54_25015 [Pseudonocardia sp.]|nr:hypothetical protein [Pseudonocardia sp.]